jgi:2-hydroxy-3-keto-5-methylthiopentenyl-1-phosphate phosphatase
MAKTIKAALIVDLDGTLLKNDFFAESLIRQLISNPFQTIFQYLKHRNWVNFKQEIISNIKPNSNEIVHLINTNVYQWINANKNHFSTVQIVSASPNKFVNEIFEIIKSHHPNSPIEEAHGSLEINLSGIRKLEYIIEKYGNNFWYIADNKSDLVIFAKSKGALLVKKDKLIQLHGELY